MTAAGSGLRNYLLSSLSSSDLACVRASLKPVDLPLEMKLEEPNQPIENIYFLEGGIASVVAGEGKAIEVGLIGREGMTGISVVFGDDRSVNRTFIQAGGSGLLMTATELRLAMDESRTLRLSLLRFAQAFSVQVAQTALVNGRAKLPARLARWLLMAHDRVDHEAFPVTHHFLSLMLGVQRPGVTLALHILEGEGLIKATRGKITVLDREGLEARSDPAYGVPETEYRRLIGGLDDPFSLDVGRRAAD